MLILRCDHLVSNEINWRAEIHSFSMYIVLVFYNFFFLDFIIFSFLQYPGGVSYCKEIFVKNIYPGLLKPKLNLQCNQLNAFRVH